MDFGAVWVKSFKKIKTIHSYSCRTGFEDQSSMFDQKQTDVEHILNLFLPVQYLRGLVTKLICQLMSVGFLTAKDDTNSSEMSPWAIFKFFFLTNYSQQKMVINPDLTFLIETRFSFTHINTAELVAL